MNSLYVQIMIHLHLQFSVLTSSCSDYNVLNDVLQAAILFFESGALIGWASRNPEL